MDENIYGDAPQPERKEMLVSAEDKSLILETCKWARFLAVLGFVMVGLYVVALLFAVLGIAVAGISLPGMYEPAVSVALVVLLLVLAVVMVVCFMPLFYLYRYASKGITAVQYGNNALMTESFLNLKRYFKFIGIFTIVMISLYIVSIVVMVAVGAFSAIGSASGLHQFL